MNRGKLCVALIQMCVGKNKSANIKHAAELIDKATNYSANVRLIVLPECFNSPYGIQHFATNAEDVPYGETCNMLCKKACEHNVYIVGGTIPEKAIGDKYFNTCVVYNPEGELVSVFRKMHLFDIDIPGKMTFKESEVLSPGNEFAVFSIDDKIKVGLGICYDMRFPELAHIYRSKYKCDMLIYPGAFNLTTGPMHWELLQRARAVDTQSFVLTCSPATNNEGYRAYGHSAVNDPWGKHISLGQEEDILYQELDFCLVEEKRLNIPTFNQRRTDIYDTILKCEKDCEKKIEC